MVPSVLLTSCSTEPARGFPQRARAGNVIHLQHDTIHCVSKLPDIVKPTSLRRRRWFRFSLRTLLIAFTLISLGLGLVFNRVQNERRAAEVIGDARGEIVYNWQIRPPDSDPNIQPAPPGPQWLRKRLGPHWFDRIVEVRLNGYINRSSKNRFTVVGPHLAKLQALRSLSLWGGELDHDDYQLLGQLTQIEKLRLRHEAELRQQDAAALAHATGIRELYLSDAKISTQALKELAKLPNLEVLDISCFYIEPSTGAIQKKYQLRDEAAEVLGTIPKLRSLMLFATQISDKGMEAIGRLSQLETLVVSSPQITSASFDYVVKLKRLEHLGTWQWKIDDAHFENLSQLPNLRSLGLVTQLTDESVPYLAKLDKIEHLTLRGEDVTDACLHHLNRLLKLKRLDISDTSVAKYGPAAKALQQALPMCMIRLPPTEREKAMQRAFRNQKWSGGSSATLPTVASPIEALERKSQAE